MFLKYRVLTKIILNRDTKFILVLEYIERGYIDTRLRIAVLHTKKELPVSEYKDKSYIITYR